MKIYFYKLIVIILSIQILCISSFGRTPFDVSNPSIDGNKSLPFKACADHRIGKINFTVTNIGTYGYAYLNEPDYFTGTAVVSCEYPKGSQSMYLFGGALWVGAVVGNDTLVSVGADGWVNVKEMNPDEFSDGGFVHRSTLDPNSSEYIDAISEDDIITYFMDTLIEGTGYDEVDGREHKPLNIKIHQNSYSWSLEHADDFILFDLEIENIGSETLSEIYVGIYMDGDVGYEPLCDPSSCSMDDITGLIGRYPVKFKQCFVRDTINTAWLADNDGDFNTLEDRRPLNVTGTRILRTPLDTYNLNYNWWSSYNSAVFDFGPRHKGTVNNPFRDFGTGGIGRPAGDRNKYYMLSKQEFDYDQIWTSAVRPEDTLWICPNYQISHYISDGLDVRYLLSFGPFVISPGERVPISFAYIGGENLHTDPDNLDNLSSMNYNPVEYFYNLDFSSFAQNSMLASWVYDNPGVDTDGDGYRGKLRLCCDYATGICDTFFYEGDGVPDFNATWPPTQPEVRISELKNNMIRVHWNGLESETTSDPLSTAIDFEGYRVYLGVDSNQSSMSLLASYDKENYLKYVWVDKNYYYIGPVGKWKIYDFPFSAEEIRCLYASSCNDLSFDPLDYNSDAPLNINDSLFYFEAVDLNQSAISYITPIRKMYPYQSYPTSLDPSEVDLSELTDEGDFKYFEYVIDIENLEAGIDYYIGVVSIDYGYMQFGIKPVESKMTIYHAIGNNCCNAVGDINHSSGEVAVNISDLILFVDFLFRYGTEPYCPAEADINGDSSINILDLLALVNYLYHGANSLPDCP